MMYLHIFKCFGQRLPLETIWKGLKGVMFKVAKIIVASSDIRGAGATAAKALAVDPLCVLNN
jgi:hypothetical protein